MEESITTPPVEDQFLYYLEALKVPQIDLYGFGVNQLVMLAVFASLLLAFIAVQRRYWWRKLLVVGLAVPILPLVGLAQIEQLSHSKPLSLLWLESQGEQGVVIEAVVTHPPEEILVLLFYDDKTRYFSLPWSEELEASMREAQRGNAQQGGQMRLRTKRFEKALRPDPQFYNDPPEAPPQKPPMPPRREPYRFDRDA